MAAPRTVPRLKAPDSTLAFLREGYTFVGNRCDALQSDAFRTRLMLTKVVCMRGRDAAQAFYRPGRLTRRGAMPSSAVALLQGRESVQALDDEAHLHRKAMFMDMMTPESIARARAILREEWRAAETRWAGQAIVLHDAAVNLFTRTGLSWCGIDYHESDVALRAAELSSMISASGTVGVRYLRARLLRRRCEAWARSLIAGARRGTLRLASGSPAEAIALHRDPEGRPLGPEAAAVELINLLRPIVAIGRFVVFAAHALHTARPGGLAGAEPSDEAIEAFVLEVRRFYPFFPLVGGRAREPFTWAGHRFAERDWLLLDLYGTNRHAGTWKDPDRFDAERFRNWEGDAWAMVAQGGGDFRTGHRCPGEWLTNALTAEAVAGLCAMDYAVPDQQLGIPLDTFPTLPRSGFRIDVAARPHSLHRQAS